MFAVLLICMNKLTVISLTVASTLSAFADVIVVGANNKLDLAPLVVAAQPLPVVTVDKKTKSELSASFNNGVGIELPFVSVGAQLGSISVGPKLLNATVGGQNSVTIGPISVGQELPSVNLGTTANKDGWLGLSVKNGINITVPFVSLRLPIPTLKTTDSTKK